MNVKEYINKNLNYLETNEWDKFFPINLYELMYLEDVNELVEKLIDSKIPIQPEIAFKNFTNIVPMIGVSEASIWQQMSADLSKILNLNITSKFSNDDLFQVWECCKRSRFEDLIDVTNLEYGGDDCEMASFEINLNNISDHTIQFRLFARGYNCFSQSDLKKLYIGSNVKELCNNQFDCCLDLEDVTYNGTIEQLKLLSFIYLIVSGNANNSFILSLTHNSIFINPQNHLKQFHHPSILLQYDDQVSICLHLLL